VGRRLDDQFLGEEDPPMEAESGGSDDNPNPSFASPTFECFFNSPSQPLFPLSGDGGDEEQDDGPGREEARADLGLCKAVAVGPGPWVSEVEDQEKEHSKLEELAANQSDDGPGLRVFDLESQAGEHSALGSLQQVTQTTDDGSLIPPCSQLVTLPHQPPADDRYLKVYTRRRPRLCAQPDGPAPSMVQGHLTMNPYQLGPKLSLSKKKETLWSRTSQPR
jgi:hypothetical protein